MDHGHDLGQPVTVRRDVTVLLNHRLFYVSICSKSKVTRGCTRS
jgi:hypothetical protein